MNKIILGSKKEHIATISKLQSYKVNQSISQTNQQTKKQTIVIYLPLPINIIPKQRLFQYYHLDQKNFLLLPLLGYQNHLVS